MSNVDLDSVRDHVQILKWAKARIAEVKELEKNARDAIEEALGDNEIGQLDGETVITWTTHKKRQFQQAKMKEDHPDLVEAYTELVEARQFKLVDPT